MFPIIKEVGWRNTFKRRLLLRDVAKVSGLAPAFFITANEIDCKKGVVVDIVSGASATLLGGASLGWINQPAADGPPSHGRLPSIDLGTTGYLNFGNIPALTDGVDNFVMTSWVVLNTVSDNLFSGYPTSRKRTVLSRAYRNPGLTGTNRSGWQLGAAQYKASTADFVYNKPGLLYNAALNSTTYVETAYDLGAFVLWATSYYPYGNTYIKEMTLRVTRAAGAPSPSSVWYSAWATQNSTALSTNSTAGTPYSLVDNGSNPLLVGATLDADTGTYPTDFLDGKVVAVGLWLGKPRITGTPLRGYMRTMLSSVAMLRGSRESTVAAPVPAEPATYRVSSTDYDTLPVMESGVTYPAGSALTLGGKVFKTINSGTLIDPPTLPSWASLRVPTLYYSMRSSTGSLVLEDVTGQLGYPAQHFGALPNIPSGATILLLKNHKVKHYADATTTSIYASDWYSRDRLIPVRVIAEEETPIEVVSSMVTVYTYGSIVFDSVQFYGGGIRLAARYGRLTLLGGGGQGNSEAWGNGIIKMFDYRLAPVTWHNATAGYGQPKWDGEDRDNLGVFGAQGEYCGPSLVTMYGGHTVGRAVQYASQHGGAFVEFYGVIRYCGGGNEAYGYGGTYGDSQYMAPMMTVSAAYMAAKEGRLKIIGGVQGTPHIAEQYGNRCALTEMHIDNLHSPAGLYPLNEAGADYRSFDINTTIFRKSSRTRLLGGYVFKPTYRADTCRIFGAGAVPITFRKWVATATGVRIHYITNDTNGTVPATIAVDIIVTYRSSVTNQKVRLSITSLNTLVQDRTIWQGIYMHADAVASEIPLPNFAGGEVSITYRKFGSNLLIDPDMETY